MCVCVNVQERQKERCEQAIADQSTDQHPEEENEEGRTRLERWVAR